jgi:hypothetical protein
MQEISVSLQSARFFIEAAHVVFDGWSKSDDRTRTNRSDLNVRVQYLADQLAPRRP